MPEELKIYFSNDLEQGCGTVYARDVPQENKGPTRHKKLREELKRARVTISKQQAQIHYDRDYYLALPDVKEDLREAEKTIVRLEEELESRISLARQLTKEQTIDILKLQKDLGTTRKKLEVRSAVLRMYVLGEYELKHDRVSFMFSQRSILKSQSSSRVMTKSKSLRVSREAKEPLLSQSDLPTPNYPKQKTSEEPEPLKKILICNVSKRIIFLTYVE
ncbi:hypothetical protein RND71_036759 [Anisodus tanguticus]|uniref:Uncharacterized protein n=1 Tax=Anisodus tanguticus TaxID=243964 RepID=A0AAE1R1S0_9SOLA|nr:hypothetical protein RND71_036759 [Anisodus tanguticus]